MKSSDIVGPPVFIRDELDSSCILEQTKIRLKYAWQQVLVDSLSYSSRKVNISDQPLVVLAPHLSSHSLDHLHIL